MTVALACLIAGRANLDGPSVHSSADSGASVVRVSCFKTLTNHAGRLGLAAMLKRRICAYMRLSDWQVFLFVQ